MPKLHDGKAETRRQPVHKGERPGREDAMLEEPIFATDDYQAADKLRDQVAIITGGDSGIGRAVAIAYAREGADVVIVYKEEDEDAQKTKSLVEAEGRKCLLIAGDVGDPEFCKDVIKQTVKELKRLDILVNNAAEQHPQKSITDITPEQLQQTFATNLFSMFYLSAAALPHLKKSKGCIINTASVVAFRGSEQLLDYSASKGAVMALTRALSSQLAEEEIRVNAVAPGPIWTPLIPSTFEAAKVDEFGTDTPMGRAGQPYECAGAYVLLASKDASYITGQTIHVNGGEVVNA